jgi:VanZ family protein
MKLLGLAAWTCVVLLAVLSLLPGDAQIRTGAPGIAEHVVAYGATAAFFTLAYPALGRVPIVLGLVAYAGLLEIAQAYVPGRYATLYDFTGGGGGVILGCLLGTLLLRQFRAREDKP